MQEVVDGTLGVLTKGRGRGVPAWNMKKGRGGFKGKEGWNLILLPYLLGKRRLGLCNLGRGGVDEHMGGVPVKGLGQS